MQTADITITAALPEHEAAIRAQSDATHLVHRQRLPHFFGPTNAYQHDLLGIALYPEKLRDSTYCSELFVAHCGDDLAGYALVFWNAPKDKGYTHITAMISDIAAFDHVREQGVAKALLAHIRGLMKTRGWDSLVADVWLDNDASHALFQNAGYAAERTEYRLGTPPPLTEEAVASAEPETSRNPWLVPIVVCIAIALIVSIQ